MESYTFSGITYKILQKIVNIEKKTREEKFEEWFNYSYELKKEEDFFLQELINKEEMYLEFYNEDLLKARFIIPILNKINFFTDKFRDWYEYEIEGVVNGYKLSGKTDFMVATGVRLPEKPYFFIQEFKRTEISAKHPIDQLHAEMAVAIEINKKNKLFGAYNIGKLWTFIIFDKLAEGKYQYYESESFDCLKINDLKQIYINLQAVKHKYCK